MKAKVIVIAALTLSFLPVWKSGGKEHLTFWSFLKNHTIWGDPVEYVPDEDYLHALKEPQ